MSTPCQGLSQLFESTELEDHNHAKAICLGRKRPDGTQITPRCPFIDGCKQLLDQTLADYGVTHGPAGTWAGHLVIGGAAHADATKPIRDTNRIDLEEATYNTEQAKTARAAYERGERTPWVMAGNRTYQRRRVAHARAKAAAKDVA